MRTAEGSATSVGTQTYEDCSIARLYMPSHPSQPELLLEEATVIKDERGCGFMVANDQDETELIVSLTGVLVGANLPPYKDTKSCAS